MSKEEKALLEHMKTHPYPLTCVRSGFWTTTDCYSRENGQMLRWWGTRTVAALVRQGALQAESHQFRLAQASS